MDILTKFQDEVIGALFATIKELIRPNSTLEDIANDYSSQMDKIILEQINNGLTYSAGRFMLRYVDEKSFCVGCLLYFKKKDNKWQKIGGLSPKMSADYFLSDNAWTYLCEHKEKTFDISAPQK